MREPHGVTCKTRGWRSVEGQEQFESKDREGEGGKRVAGRVGATHHGRWAVWVSGPVKGGD